MKWAEAEIGFARARRLGIEAEFGMRCVVTEELAWPMRSCGMGFGRDRVAQHLFDRGTQHATVAQQFRTAIQQAHHG